MTALQARLDKLEKEALITGKRVNESSRREEEAVKRLRELEEEGRVREEARREAIRGRCGPAEILHCEILDWKQGGDQGQKWEPSKQQAKNPEQQIIDTKP
jgi:3'-phosphoadenosine 5'-phosphosulfate sulfotransferase (PAPS reductase)/FAD synthetase